LIKIPSHLLEGFGVGTLTSVRGGRLILLLSLWKSKLNFARNIALTSILKEYTESKN
jgi:hypothetical protein